MHRRPSKLLDYTADNGGLLELKSEYDTAIESGDFVYITGESSLDVFTESHMDAFDPFDPYAKGYEVVSVDASNNSIVINYAYSGSITIGVSHISTVYQASGHVSYGLIYSACVGEDGATDKIRYGNETMPPVFASVFNVPMNTAYINWLGGTFKTGRWHELSIAPPSTTVKYTMSGSIPVPVTTSPNNNGYGYTWFRSGEFGNADDTQPVKFANGTMYNADWLSGLLSGGILDGDRGRIEITTIEAYAGTTVGCVFNGGNIYGGTHHGARDVRPSNIAFDTFPSPNSIIVSFSTEEDIQHFASGDVVSLHVQKTPNFPAPPAPGLPVDTFLDYYNHISDTISSGDITINTGTNTYTLELDIPAWLDTSVPLPFLIGRFYATKGVFIDCAIDSATLDMAHLNAASATDIIVTNSTVSSTLVSNAVLYNCAMNSNNDDQSKLTGGLLQSCSISKLHAINGRMIGGITIQSDIDGGIWQGAQMRLSNIRSGLYESLFVSGQFIDSYKDSSNQWEQVNYVSGNWTGYTGPPALVTNGTLVYTDWHPTASPGGLNYAVLPPNYGTWNNVVGPYNVSTNYYSPDVATVLGIQVIDDLTSNVYSERVVVDGNLKTQIDSTNTAISGSLPLPGFINIIEPTGQVTAAAGQSRVRYIKYDSVPVDPTGYTVQLRLTIGVTEYGPGPVSIGSPGSAILKMNIDTINAATQWPDDAIKVTGVNVIITPGPPPMIFPSGGGTLPQYIPNLGGGSPTPWGGAASYTLIDTTLSSPITFAVSPSDTVMVNVSYDFKLTAGGSYTSAGQMDTFTIL